MVSKAVDLDSLMIDEFRRDDLADDEWKLLGDSLQSNPIQRAKKKPPDPLMRG